MTDGLSATEPADLDNYPLWLPVRPLARRLNDHSAEPGQGVVAGGIQEISRANRNVLLRRWAKPKANVAIGGRDPVELEMAEQQLRDSGATAEAWLPI